MTGPDTIDQTLAQFEGLISETARQILRGGVELEREDLVQLLTIKAWQAIAAHDAARLPLRRYVFGCLYNLRKDIEKRPRRHNSSIEDIRSRGSGGIFTATYELSLEDWFDGQYLSIDAEQVYFEVEDEPVPLPSTLTRIERRVIRLRLRGRTLQEVEREMKLSRTDRERLMASIREKLADWAPSPRSGPTAPLPTVAATRAVLAA